MRLCQKRVVESVMLALLYHLWHFVSFLAMYHSNNFFIAFSRGHTAKLI